MAKSNKTLEEALICVTGFVIGAIAASSFTEMPGTTAVEPNRIDWLFDHAEPMARQMSAEGDQPSFEMELPK
ncbi:hypothetical protein E1180_12820 [Roseibium denhamense]|uniref:Uncharacterized protein n=1 Tax=Roseibium denhamense TaxID=76305 RepID=A0ABY1NGD0_9HYPH|nr:hypothetical protein [Roseibium denhamense]MTI06399.1 hypothetical protein [Roseibium denhamense]SMP08885.1 hypothetical protein SAMN06265374_1029 [Roseibium denhamense]